MSGHYRLCPQLPRRQTPRVPASRTLGSRFFGWLTSRLVCYYFLEGYGDSSQPSNSRPAGEAQGLPSPRRSSSVVAQETSLGVFLCATLTHDDPSAATTGSDLRSTHGLFLTFNSCVLPNATSKDERGSPLKESRWPQKEGCACQTVRERIVHTAQVRNRRPIHFELGWFGLTSQLLHHAIITFDRCDLSAAPCAIQRPLPNLVKKFDECGAFTAQLVSKNLRCPAVNAGKRLIVNTLHCSHGRMPWRVSLS